MSTSDAPNLRRLARQLADYGRRLHHLETVPQLAHSSLDDHGMPVYDADGNLTVTVGKQPDGTWGAKPVAGPVPPRPVGLDAEGDAGTIRASWQGVFWAGAALPMDFEAVQVLVDGSVYAAIHDPEGGSIQVPALPGERLVSFRTLSQAGVVSEDVAFGAVTVDPRVSEQMLELGENLAELRDVTLPGLADELDDAASDLQSKLDAANARIDDIIVDGGGAGNFTTYSINEPSSDGTGEGDQWFRVVNGEVIGQWRWDGAAWVPVTLTDAIIAGIDLSKLVSNGNLSEVVANKMFTDIFTANKITSQEIAAGSITTEKIAAEGIVADVIQGGAFTGETFTGGTFTGGLFKTSDTLPGQVEFADNAYMPSYDPGATYPGIRVEPIDDSTTAIPPGLGSYGDGVVIDGGKATDGSSSYAVLNPRAFFARTFRGNGTMGAEVQTFLEASLMRTYRENGDTAAVMQTSPDTSLMRTYSGNSSESGWVQVQPRDAELAYVDPNNTYFSRIKADANEAYLFTRAGGASRYLSVDADGIWVKTGAKAYNLEETAQDSGWNSFPVKGGITASSDLAWRNKNGVIYFRGTVDTNWVGGQYTEVVTGLPAAMRPASDMIALSPDSSNVPMVIMMTASGTIRVWKSSSGTRGTWMSMLSYPLG